MNQPLHLQARLTALAILLSCAAVMIAGCSRQGTVDNVTTGKPLPVYHQLPGQPSPGDMAANSRANRKQVP